MCQRRISPVKWKLSLNSSRRVPEHELGVAREKQVDGVEILLIEDFPHVERVVRKHFYDFPFVDEEMLHFLVESHEVQLEFRSKKLFRTEQVSFFPVSPKEAPKSRFLDSEFHRVNRPFLDKIERIRILTVDFKKNCVQSYFGNFESVFGSQVNLNQKNVVIFVFEGQQVQPFQLGSENLRVNAQFLDFADRAKLANFDGPGQFYFLSWFLPAITILKIRRVLTTYNSFPSKNKPMISLLGSIECLVINM